MEHQKTLNLLNEANGSKFVTRKWNIVNDNLKTEYNAAKEITYTTEILKSVAATPATQGSFKKCAPFTKDITMQICL